jgi:hypothetical protein
MDCASFGLLDCWPVRRGYKVQYTSDVIAKQAQHMQGVSFITFIYIYIECMKHHNVCGPVPSQICT